MNTLNFFIGFSRSLEGQGTELFSEELEDNRDLFHESETYGTTFDRTDIIVVYFHEEFDEPLLPQRAGSMKDGLQLDRDSSRLL